MSEVLKVLGQLAPSAASLTDIYTVPAATSAVISSIIVANTDASVATSFRVTVAVAGAGDSVEQYIYDDIVINGADTFTASLGLTLAATDVVRVYATLATLSFNIYGSELT